MKKDSSKLLRLIIYSLFGTISMVLMLLNFPLPLLPAYLKVDFSEVPALVAALLFSPIAGVAVEAVKNLLYLIYTGAADPVGVLANFLAGVLFVVPAAMIYHRFRTTKTLVSGLTAGTIVLGVGMSILNYFVILPIYSWFMGWETMSAEVKWLTTLGGILPFNLLKGIIVSLLFVPLFMKLKPWFDRKGLGRSQKAA